MINIHNPLELVAKGTNFLEKYDVAVVLKPGTHGYRESQYIGVKRNQGKDKSEEIYVFNIKTGDFVTSFNSFDGYIWDIDKELQYTLQNKNESKHILLDSVKETLLKIKETNLNGAYHKDALLLGLLLSYIDTMKEVSQ